MDSSDHNHESMPQKVSNLKFPMPEFGPFSILLRLAARVLQQEGTLAFNGLRFRTQHICEVVVR